MIQCLVLLLPLAVSAFIPDAQVSCDGGKLRFSASGGDSRISLMAFHYNINQPLSGVAAGRWNYDVTRNHLTNGNFVHENNLITLKNGDEVNYWTYAIRNGGGSQKLNQKFVCSLSGRNVVQNKPLTPSKTAKPSGRSSAPPSDSSNSATVAPGVTIRLIQPTGFQIEISDTSGQTLAAVHYRINSNTYWHYDITQKTGSKWIWKHTRSGVKKGDVISFWINRIKGKRGYVVKDLQWSVTGDNKIIGGSAPADLSPPHLITKSNQPTTTWLPPSNTVKIPSNRQGCPHQRPGLTRWSPGHNVNSKVIISSGQKYLLTQSATVYSIVIKDGGVLILDDTGREILLRARHIIIAFGGELHIGSESCRYLSKAKISLYGDRNSAHEYPGFGQKALGVGTGGTLEIHGEKKLSWTLLNKSLVKGSENPTIELLDDVNSWHPGDRIVITSTDFNAEQAEEFTVEVVNGKQVKVRGTASYSHFGRVSDGVDMRAEVALLTRNIVITGEMRETCYGDNRCKYFDYDTFGGHMMFLGQFKNIHIEGAEITKMGQQLLARYPIHFHLCDDVDEKGGYSKPTYVQELSIHHVFHRCVTLHRTDGLLVKDVAAYRTNGHCYFLEEGAERRNILDHNLAAVVDYSSALPSDRNTKMCIGIREGVLPGYKPNAGDCNSLSAFWITHPDNTIINNAVAGVQGTGYWYIFHHEPAGFSKGKIPAGQSSATPIKKFENNRAHACLSGSFTLDNGVKNTPPTSRNPRLQFSVGAGLYMPYKNANRNGERATAVIKRFTGFKNGAWFWARGGDILVTDSAFADTSTAMSLASSGEMPYVPGSHQAVVNTVFVGESDNKGSPMRAPRIVGLDLYDGPVRVEGCTFLKFTGPQKGEWSNAAIGFHVSNPSHMSTTTVFKNNKFDSQSRRVSISPQNADGDRTSIFYDEDGTVSGYKRSYVTRADYYLVQHEGCVKQTDWNAVVCGGKNDMVWIEAYGADKISVTNDQFPDNPVVLKGVVRGRYMPSFALQNSYTLLWDGPVPAKAILKMINFDRGDLLIMALCYPRSAQFTSVYYHRLHVRGSERQLNAVGSRHEVERGAGDSYYFDRGTGLFYVKLIAREIREGWNYCSKRGCERIVIQSNAGGQRATCTRNRIAPKRLPVQRI